MKRDPSNTADTQIMARLFGPNREKLLVLFLALFLTMPLLANTQESGAEYKLESIKQALVDLAMQKDIRLGSSAYLDNQGVLHETALMSTQTEVRGVRVIEYLEDAGVPGATLQFTTMRSRSCLGSQSGLRRQATIRTLNNTEARIDDVLVGDHSVGELSVLLKQQLYDATAISAQWSITDEVDFSSDYMRYLTSSAVNHVPYSFHIDLRRVSSDRALLADEKALLLRGISQLPGAVQWAPKAQRPWPEVKLEYQLTLVEKSTNRQLWQGHRDLIYPKANRGYRKNPYPEQLIAQAKKTTEIFMRQINTAMECHSDHYPLATLSGDAQRRTINAGAIAGLRIGDQFLISPSADILQQSMSLAGMATLGLARVESVSAHSATLVNIAGPQWVVQPNNDAGFAIYF